jgi:hypothetical protein
MLKTQTKNSKAQSAMEYLMTYGWAILIIAVVLGALFSLGVFSSTSLIGTACVATPGYLCQTPILSHATGGLSFVFGQSTGATLYNISIACSATANSLGYPQIPLGLTSAATAPGNVIFNPTVLTYGFSAIGGDGLASNDWTAGNSMSSGQTLQVSGISCFTNTGVDLTSGSGATSNAPAVGAGYVGSLWVAYNTAANNLKVDSFAKFATITVKAS